MQSSVMAFFPSVATSKLELNSLYRKYVDMFGISLNNSTVGCHLTRKMAHLPAVLIDRTFFSTGTAIQSIAISYGALIQRWLLNRTSAVQFILGHSANVRGESVLTMDNNELGNDETFLSSLLGRKRDYVGLVLQGICYPACLKVVDIPQKKLSFSRQWTRSGHDTSKIWRVMVRNEQYLACMIVLAALQLFLRLIRVNVTVLFLPMLSRAISSRGSPAVIGNIVLVLVNSCGVLGSALSVKQFGREVTFAISAIVMVVCQVAIPLILEVQIGVGGGTRMPTGYTTALFALTCVVSCGLSWSWGSFFWTFPGRKVYSAGQVLAMALNLGVCYAQMQYFLLMLCRLKNATLVYYALWIWS